MITDDVRRGYRVWKGLEQCPSWWLDQNRFERA